MTRKIGSILPSEGPWALLWPSIIVAMAPLGSSLIACAMPLVAIATLAAATMTRRQALITLVLCWVINQALGFGVHNYPPTLLTIGWGLAAGFAAIVALVVAQGLLAPGQVGLRMVPVLGLGFVAYELVLFAFSQITGWACPFTFDVVSAVATNEALWFVGLWLAYVGLGLVLPVAGQGARPCQGEP